jgi:hypothetical protein
LLEVYSGIKSGSTPIEEGKAFLLSLSPTPDLTPQEKPVVAATQSDDLLDIFLTTPANNANQPSPAQANRASLTTCSGKSSILSTYLSCATTFRSITSSPFIASTTIYSRCATTNG